jgi:integrase
MPFTPMLKEDNRRTGFFEEAELAAILEHLPSELHPPVRFMFVTGWRKSEVLSLSVGQVDLDQRVVRLEVGTTKSGEGRVFVMTTGLYELLARQLESVESLKARGVICPWVFHRSDGRPIKSFRKAWTAACLAAGYPDKILHDFRRTAVRNLERAGVPRSTAMAMVGHKTEAIYRRYAIVDERMHREASEKLDRWHEAQKKMKGRS